MMELKEEREKKKHLLFSSMSGDGDERKAWVKRSLGSENYGAIAVTLSHEINQIESNGSEPEAELKRDFCSETVGHSGNFDLEEEDQSWFSNSNTKAGIATMVKNPREATVKVVILRRGILFLQAPTSISSSQARVSANS